MTKSIDGNISNKHYTIGSDAIKLTSSKVITMIISVVTAMLLSRFRTLEEYGTYSQILMVINLTTAIFMLGLPNSVNYFLSRAETNYEREKFLSVYYTFSSLLSIIIGVVLVLSLPMIALLFNNNIIKNFIYVFAVYPWAITIMSSIENVLIVYRKTDLIIKYRIGNSIAVLFVILIVQLLRWDFNMFMLLFVIVQAVFTICVYFIVRKVTGGLRVLLDKSVIKDISVFSIPIGLASVVGTINIQLDKIMISNLFDVNQLAIFANASNEMPVTVIASSLTAVLLPQLAVLLKKGENKEAIYLWGNVTLLSYIIISFLATGFFIFASDVITLLYSEKYLPGVAVFRVFNIVLLLRCTYFGMILNSKGKTKFILYSSICSLLLNIILNYIFYLMFGFIGPAIATLLSQSAISVLQLAYTSKTVDISFSKILPWKNIAIITILNCSLGLIFYFVKQRMPFESIVGSISESIFLGIIWGAIYFTVCFKQIKNYWIALNKGE